MSYTASIKVLGHIYTADGASVPDAISQLKPLKARGMSVLALTYGEKQKSRVLSSLTTTRLFSPSKLTREIALKQVAHMFDGFDK